MKRTSPGAVALVAAALALTAIVLLKLAVYAASFILR